ncbi:hexosaminidase [Spirosoma lacussanchae]|uniref:beta-N-acetylhexosaminidase n=1 Tax=Spirosoma lacussanchae TaxID=1884249 RepID=UPI001107D8B9|nr:family 20 glycosylhydrolase [Spirosoma lacussanchae]
MKRHYVWLIGLLISTIAQAQQPLALIPQPVSVQTQPGTFALTRSTAIRYNKPAGQAVADRLASQLSRPTGFPLGAKAGSGSGIQLNLTDTPDAQLGPEGYRLSASPKGVVITANQPAGLFYGAQTLLQLLPKEIESTAVTPRASWAVPAVQIIDYPRFGWRGIMLDVSRHFFSKDDVKRYIDEMARYKFNTLHWHLTDDNGWRIEIKALPKLTEVGAWRVARAGHFGDRADPQPGEPVPYGGFYTHDDIREVVAYAQARNVTIVPEIDVPGHSMAALAAYPELSCTKAAVSVNPGTPFADWYGNGTFKMKVENTLNPSDEKVYDFLDKVFTEVAALFPNPYIHVGGDECYKGYWAQDPGCQALMKKLNIRHVEDLQGYFMNRVMKIVQAKGKKMIGWDEILEGGIASDATVMSWRGIKGGIEAAHAGHNVVMTPSTFAYIDYLQGDPTIEPPIYASLRASKSYSFEPVPDGVDPKFILGGQANLWTEQIPTLRHAEYMTYPRGWALAEVYWSPKTAKDWAGFVPRLEAHFDRADAAGVNYSRAIYDAIVRTSLKDGKLVVELESETPGLDLYYTIDDTMPDGRSPKYSQPITLPDGPITLRVITYRAGKPIGRLITLTRDAMQKRVGRF